MDKEERCSEEEYAEAYKEWFWRKEFKQWADEIESQFEAADMRRKEIKESQL